MPEVKKPAHSVLNEYAQKNGTNKKLPEYKMTERIASNKMKEFIATCHFEGKTTEGVALSKNEAKRISAGRMLVLLHEIDPSKFVETPKKVQEEPVIDNKLEDFDRSKLEIYFDKFLEDREKNYSKFRRLFVGDLPEKPEEQFQLNEDVESPKSKTLEKLKMSGFVNLSNACTLFKAIVQEMKLTYFAEFLETAKNDRYAVVIKLNLNLFTAGGIGETPEQAIQNTCKNAIEFLLVFNS